MIKLIAKYLKNYRFEAVAAPLGKLFEAVFELIVPIVMARIIDTGIKNSDTEYIAQMCAVLVVLGVLGLASSLTAQFFAAKAAVGLGTELRRDLFAHIDRFSYAEIDKLGASTLVTRMTVDINTVQAGVNMLLRLFMRSPFIVIGAVAAALYISVKATIIFLLFTPLMGIVIYWCTKKTVPLYKKIQQKLDSVTLITGENISGVRVIRAFSRQNDERTRFDNAADELCGIQTQAGRASSLMSPMTYVLVNIAIILILWRGGIDVSAGSLTQGEVIALINLMTQILLSLVRVAELVMHLSRTHTSSLRIAEIFAAQPAVSDSGNTKVKENYDAPAIEFKNVSFGYFSAERNALEHISFSIKRGETVGIIGGTGCGKTTLINLIPRFYDANDGEVLVDGINVKEYPFEQLRGKMGIVEQHAVLFRGTVRDNLKWRNENITEEQMIKALKTAQAYDFIMENGEGLDRTVGQDGKNFSGGQRQRLTIARALAGDPEIMILDDPASALDPATDAALRHSIAAGKGDSTVVIVSQRISSIRNADRIIVIEDGRIAGIGPHSELLKTCGVYAQICDSQMGKGGESV